MLSEISQRKTNTVWFHLYVECKKVEIIKTETRLSVARGKGWEKWGDMDKRVETSSYKKNEFWRFKNKHGDYIKSTVLHTQKLLIE